MLDKITDELTKMIINNEKAKLGCSVIYSVLHEMHMVMFCFSYINNSHGFMW